MATIEAKNSAELTDLSKMTRDEVVPYYLSMLPSAVPQAEIIRVNQLIIRRWSNAALVYIKEAAWKAYGKL